MGEEPGGVAQTTILYRRVEEGFESKALVLIHRGFIILGK